MKIIREKRRNEKRGGEERRKEGEKGGINLCEGITRHTHNVGKFITWMNISGPDEANRNEEKAEGDEEREEEERAEEDEGKVEEELEEEAKMPKKIIDFLPEKKEEIFS